MDDIDALIEALTNSRRRHVLALLADADRPIPASELARQFVAAEHEVHPADVTERQYDRARVSLRHVILPALVEDGLIVRGTGGEGIELVKPRPIETLLGTHDDVPRTELAALGDEHRREIVTVLRERETPIGMMKLAEELTLRRNERETAPDAPVDAIVVSLYHQHLPTLADAGVVSFDASEKIVAYSGSSALEKWITLLENVAYRDDSMTIDDAGRIATYHS